MLDEWYDALTYTRVQAADVPLRISVDYVRVKSYSGMQSTGEVRERETTAWYKPRPACLRDSPRTTN